MSSARKNVKKRGGTFSREQLEMLKQYLQTKRLPPLESLANANLLSTGQAGIYGRFKSASKRLMILDDEVMHIVGKIVIPKEEFIAEISTAHKGETGGPHLNFEDTLKKLSETYTIGRRTFGMSKKLIEAVVKACNSGPCWKKKKSNRKRDYESFVRKYARKCSDINQSPSLTMNVSSTVTKTTNQTSKDTSMFKQTTSTVLAHTIVKCGPKEETKTNVLKEEKKTQITKEGTQTTVKKEAKQMPVIIQMKSKSKPVETNKPKSTETPSTGSVNKPGTITIGPLPFSMLKNASGTSQYQLILPLVNQQLITSQNSNSVPNTTRPVLNFPILNITSNMTSSSGLIRPTATVLNTSNKGNATSTTNVPLVSGNSSFTPWSSTALPLKLQNISSVPQSATTTITHSTKPADIVINIPVNSSNSNLLKIMLKQNIENKLEKSSTATVSEPPRKKTKTVKQMLETKLNSGKENLGKDGVKQKIKSSMANLEDDNDVVMLDDETVDQNNNTNYANNDNCNNNTSIDENVSDNDQILDHIKSSGMYRNCLKALTGLPMEDFETVIERLTSNLFSEGQNPFSVPFYPSADPPYPHIWYFPHEIQAEDNIFKRIMIVMKDIRVDMNRGILHEFSALDRLIRKIQYMEALIRKNRTYLNMCSTKSQKETKKKR